LNPARHWLRGARRNNPCRRAVIDEFSEWSRLGDFMTSSERLS
jgi:hypothetical protein